MLTARVRLLPRVRLRMIGVGLPVGRVLLGQRRVLYHEQVLRVVLFGGLREVKGSRQDGRLVDHHDLVVGNRVGGIDPETMLPNP